MRCLARQLLAIAAAVGYQHDVYLAVCFRSCPYHTVALFAEQDPRMREIALQRNNEDRSYQPQTNERQSSNETPPLLFIDA